MISEETYYRRAFAAARARGEYVGFGRYQAKDGRAWRVRTFEDWNETPERGNLEEVST